MPGWHEATTEAQKSGRVKMLGIIQEQHPERARLFMQWKEMEWPLLVDSLNLYKIKVVPITLFIDEWGIVRNTRPRPEDLEEFLSTPFPRPENLSTRPEPVLPDPAADADPIIQADRYFLLAQTAQSGDRTSFLVRSIEKYEAAIQKRHDDADAHFRLGVAYRSRFDSASRASGDFGQAIHHWKTALDLDPNQYIWRRRIQQYGPRLDKPYSFYDWVVDARDQIAARGQTPVTLTVEPGGAEVAGPARSLETDFRDTAEPDPQGRIDRDSAHGRRLINVESVVVPNTSRPGSYRIHLLFEPDSSRKAHWNNEAEPMQVWIDVPEGWRIDRRPPIIPNADRAASTEVRLFEVEVAHSGGGDVPEVAMVRGYALYNVCEDVDGVCLYRRLDFEVQLPKQRPD